MADILSFSLVELLLISAIGRPFLDRELGGSFRRLTKGSVALPVSGAITITSSRTKDVTHVPSFR